MTQGVNLAVTSIEPDILREIDLTAIIGDFCCKIEKGVWLGFRL